MPRRPGVTEAGIAAQTHSRLAFQSTPREFTQQSGADVRISPAPALGRQARRQGGPATPIFLAAATGPRAQLCGRGQIIGVQAASAEFDGRR